MFKGARRQITLTWKSRLNEWMSAIRAADEMKRARIHKNLCAVSISVNIHTIPIATRIPS